MRGGRAVEVLRSMVSNFLWGWKRSSSGAFSPSLMGRRQSKTSLISSWVLVDSVLVISLQGLLLLFGSAALFVLDKFLLGVLDSMLVMTLLLSLVGEERESLSSDSRLKDLRDRKSVV